MAAGDANDDEDVQVSDAIWTLAYLFANGDPPPLPGPLSCGPDPTDPDPPDEPLTCLEYAAEFCTGP